MSRPPVAGQGRSGPRRAAVAAAALAALAVPATASAATTTVDAGPTKAFQGKFQAAAADANTFFRRTVTIHKGDSVRWRINGFHAVTFSPRGNPPQPLIEPDTSTPLADVVDAAGNPFWFNGLPRTIINPLVAFPQGGTTFRPGELENSGLPPEEGGPPEPYVLRFNRKGTFSYYCPVHPGMDGKVRVVGKRTTIPTRKANRLAARRAQERLLKRVQILTTGRGTPKGDVIQAGNDDAAGSTVFKFFPPRKTVKVGTTVRLQMDRRTTETHTFSFGPTNGKDLYLDQLAQSFITPAPNPAGPPTLVADGRAVYPSEPPPAGVPALTPTLHGNGFLNSGALDGAKGSPIPRSSTVRFDQPGTYTYICIIHPFMTGTVTVEP